MTIGNLAGYFQSAVKDPSAFGQVLYFLVPLFVLIFLVVIWVIVFMNDSERRIPVQYAKRVMGRKMYGGQSSSISRSRSVCRVLCRLFCKLHPLDPQHH